jgi:2-polyprenyl-3-methyl-5-hydroxy-6-metoxy-1,4-benzoquinol methylase
MMATSMINQKEDVWEKNFSCRKEELETRGDKTYWEILVPAFRNAVRKTTPHETVLDAGCGLGYLTDTIAPEVKEITGIDKSHKLIEFAQGRFKKRNTHFVHMSIIDFQKANPDRLFDICIANMVFHNIHHLDKNMEAIRQLLKPQGVLLFSIPHPSFWYSSRPYFDKDSFFYEKEKDYQVPFKIKNFDQHPSLITYWHRSLEHYADILKKNSFVIISMKEPALPDMPIVKDLLLYTCKKT